MKLLSFVDDVITLLKVIRGKPAPTLPKARGVFFLDPAYNAVPAPQPLPFPRKSIVSTSISGIIYLCLLSACLAAIPVALLQGVLDDRTLDQNGVPARATVTNCERTRSGRPEIIYSYRVTDSKGAVLQFKDRALGNYYQSCAKQGQIIAIQYLVENPTTTRSTEPGFAAGGADLGLFILTTVAAIIPLVLLIITVPRHIHSLWRYQQFVSKGVLLPGQIAAAAWRTVRGHTKLSVEYEFTTPDKRDLKRKQSRVRLDLPREQLPVVGTPVRVLYVNDRLHILL